MNDDSLLVKPTVHLFDRMERWGAAISPLPADCKAVNGIDSTGRKRPAIVYSFYSAVKDRLSWELWDQGNPECNWLISCVLSGLIGVEIDPKVKHKVTGEKLGVAHALECWDKQRQIWNLPSVMPHVISRSGGYHFYFRIPPGVDPFSLVQRPIMKLDDYDQAVIDCRVKGYLVLPPSTYGGAPYKWMAVPNLPDPHPAPDGLLAHCAGTPIKKMRTIRPTRDHRLSDGTLHKAGKYELAQFAAAVLKADAAGAWEDREDHRNLGFVIKAEYGEAGRDLYFAVTRPGKADDEAQWASYADIYAPGKDLTILSIFKHMQKFGVKDHIQETLQSLFGTVAPALDMSKVATGISVSQTAPNLLTVNLDAIAKRGAPVLAAVPTMVRPEGCPMLPEGCNVQPLYDEVNRVIPALMVDPAAYFDAWTFVYLTHRETFNRIADLTPALDRNAVVLRADGIAAEIHRANFITFSDFQRNGKTGEPLPNCSDNVIVFLKRIGADVRFNAWTNRTELRKSDADPWQELDDALLQFLLMKARNSDHQFNVGKDFLLDMLEALGHQRVVDPALEHLDRLQAKWDGHERLATWLTVCCGVPDDAYHRAVAVNIIGGMVRRIRQAGCKHDPMAIFCSTQGKAKSTLCEIIAMHSLPNRDWFNDSPVLGQESKELILALEGRTLCEIAEMQQKSSASILEVKATLSRKVDRARMSYGRRLTHRPRRGIFVGTSNDDKPLNDPTGGRRFLPVVVNGAIDLEWMRAHIDQLIAEACVLESQGLDFQMPESVWADAAKHQEAAREQTIMEEELRDFFEVSHFGALTDGNGVAVVGTAVDTTNAFITTEDLNTLTESRKWKGGPKLRSQIMQALGFGDPEKTPRPYIDRKRRRIWLRGEFASAVRYNLCRNLHTGLATVVPLKHEPGCGTGRQPEAGIASVLS